MVMLAILFGYCWTFLTSGLMFYFSNMVSTAVL